MSRRVRENPTEGSFSWNQKQCVWGTKSSGMSQVTSPWLWISVTVSHGSFCNKMVKCSLNNSPVSWIHCSLEHFTAECWLTALWGPGRACCWFVLGDTLLRDLREGMEICLFLLQITEAREDESCLEDRGIIQRVPEVHILICVSLFPPSLSKYLT